MAKYILSLDQGTTSSRAIVFDKSGCIIAKAQHEYPQIYPQAGWVEHNPDDILKSQLRALADALINGQIEAKDIAAIGITNQRETTILWDKTTGKPVYNAIVWQCRRTAEMCKSSKKRGWPNTSNSTPDLSLMPISRAQRSNGFLTMFPRRKDWQMKVSFCSVRSKPG